LHTILTIDEIVLRR